MGMYQDVPKTSIKKIKKKIHITLNDKMYKNIKKYKK